MTQFHAERIGPAIVLGQLAAVIDFDAVARELERIKRGGLAGRGGGLKLVGAHTHADRAEIDAVEFLGQRDQRGIAARRNVGDDGAHHLLDVGRGLALRIEERPEFRGKVGGAGVEADGHCGSLHPSPAWGRVAASIASGRVGKLTGKRPHPAREVYHRGARRADPVARHPPLSGEGCHRSMASR